MRNYTPFWDLFTTTLGRLDMNKPQLSTIALLLISTSLVGFILGCKPADESVGTTQPAEETKEIPVSLNNVAPANPEPASIVPAAIASKPKATNQDHPSNKGDHPAGKKKADNTNSLSANASGLNKDLKNPAVPAILLPQAIVASPAILELGTFSTSEKSTGVVTLTNTAEEAVTLISARASCGCTTSDFQKNTVLNPGESTDITITMDGKGKARKLSKNVTFTIDGRPPLRLEVKGETISFVKLDIDPLVIDEENGSSTITLTSTDGEPFKVLSILPAIVANLGDEAAPTQELLIDWDTFWDLVRTTKVTIRLDHPKCREITTNVRLSAEQRKRLNDIIKERRAGNELPIKDPTRPLTGDQMARYIKAGRGEQVLKYINAGQGKFDAVDRGGVALLSTAAQEGDAVTVAALLELGAQIERVDRVNRTPLMYGARSKNVEVISVLLDVGADIQARDSLGNTALSWAAGFGIGDVVLALVDAGADVNTVDNVLGYTPLLWAAGFGEPQSIQVLLESGADVEIHDTAEGRTPLMHAVRTGDAEAVVLLISSGANVNALDNGNQTALHIGALSNNVKLEKIITLVEAGADPNAKDKSGQTPLDLAEARTDDAGKEVANYLTEHTKSE